MPKKPTSKPTGTDIPDTLKPYVFNGVDLTTGSKGKEALGECPFCGVEDKFHVNLATGKARCWYCSIDEGKKKSKGGINKHSFVRLLHKKATQETRSKDLVKLGEERGIDPEALKAWGWAKHPILDNWCIPGYNQKGVMCNLYRWVRVRGKDDQWERRLLPTPTMGHHLFGMNLFDETADETYICEGPWDGPALWQSMGSHKFGKTRLLRTKHRDRSLLQRVNVLAMPGIQSFVEGWCEIFDGVHTVFMFDNDHPKHRCAKCRETYPYVDGDGDKRTKCPKCKSKLTVIAPAAFQAVQRCSGIVGKVTDRVSYLSWGPQGYTTSLPSGTDVRDCLVGAGIMLADADAPKARKRGKGADKGQKAPGVAAERLQALLAMVEPVPDAWRQKATQGLRTGTDTAQDASTLPACTRWRDLVLAWRKAFKFTPGLNNALAVMLASITSVKCVGDQLWVKVIGPASCGKSTLCEAVSTNADYVLAKSTIRGFHSGFKTGGDEKEDNSLLTLLRDKTLVTKDGDTLLQSPNLNQILSEGRDIYDTVSRSHYRNKMGKDYKNLRMTWLLCGTSSLRSIDSSELGERFLDCVIMEGIDDDFEDEVLTRIAKRAKRNMGITWGHEGSGEGGGFDPLLVEAQKLTGGYINYLRQNAQELLSAVDVSNEDLYRLTRLAKFIAFMRARPSKHHDENAEREFGGRLTEQVTRLAMCLAVVLNKEEVDDDVMKRVLQVTMDTARGRSYDMAQQLYESEYGLEAKPLSIFIGWGERATRGMLRFLRDIGVVEIGRAKPKKGIKKSTAKTFFHLATNFRKLYREVHYPDGHGDPTEGTDT